MFNYVITMAWTPLDPAKLSTSSNFKRTVLHEFLSVVELIGVGERSVIFD